MTEEETGELDDQAPSSSDVPATTDVMAQMARRVAKAGARNSAADLDRIQAVHDASVELGAQCGSQKAMQSHFF